MDGELTPRELEDRLVEGDPLVVDVRDGASYSEEHIPDSEHVPFAEIPAAADRIAEADEVVTVCYEGLASVKAARLIASHREFDGEVRSLEGGMEAWQGPVDGGTDGTADEDEGPDAPF
jgi:rhodanese-related sulfurtransferase